ncbi:MAG: SDR family oxidoreductase [Fuerstiella sp.]|nr:SDR family oxidoreductase [Fuerstiella sp.]MCP4859091.1 SDR family oxidoreductase [Fuerstiella sp.]
MTTETTPLASQIAWVTGSSRGLGKVMAEELARLGAKVAVHGSRSDSPRTFDEGGTMEELAADIADRTDAEVMATWGDVTSEEDVQRVADQIRTKWQQIDILVCCAGGDIGAGGTAAGRGGRPDQDDCLQISVNDLKSVMDRNLLGTMLCCRAVATEMMDRKQGRIITIGSIAGCVGRPAGSIYGVAKAGVHAWTRCLAEQLRPHNIPVNCVAPGGTVTERFLRIHEIDEEWLATEGTLERYGRPEEIASVVGFLCTDAARFVSGQIIRVDGASQTFAG